MNIPEREEFEKICDLRFGKETYDKLRSAQVAIAGLGGLGSNIAAMLTRSCIGKLLLVDFDVVDISNLNRQIYDIRHINIKKTEALSEYLKTINPYIEIETKNIRVTEDNAGDIFKDYKIVCEAFDKPDNKAMLVNTLLEQCPDTILVSGVGMAGYGDSNQIVTKKLGKRLFICGDGETDISHGIGLMAPRVQICAGHQANKVIQLILNS